jgi:hypothetical protein
MAIVLCVGINPELLATRKMILERAGHTTFIATSQPEMERACAEHRFDVVVVGQRIVAPEKRRLFALARACTPEAKVLELYEQSGTRELPDADDWLLVPTDVPADLLERIERLTKLT